MHVFDSMYLYRTSFTKRIPARLTVAGVALRREWISKIILMVAVSGMRSLDTKVRTCRQTDRVAEGLSLTRLGDDVNGLGGEVGEWLTPQGLISSRKQVENTRTIPCCRP